MRRAKLENTAVCYATVYVCIYSTNNVLYLTLIVYRLIYCIMLFHTEVICKYGMI